MSDPLPRLAVSAVIEQDGRYLVVELEAEGSGRMRSPLVLASIVDYEAGRRFPLELLRDFP